jgi:hypothetical protein
MESTRHDGGSERTSGAEALAFASWCELLGSGMAEKLCVPDAARTEINSKNRMLLVLAFKMKPTARDQNGRDLR